MTKRRKLDLPQAIVIAVVLGSIIIAAGLVMTFGPEDRSAEVAGWIAQGISALGVLFAALRSKGLLEQGKDSDDV